MPYFPCINNMNVMFYSFGIRFSLKYITAFYYAKKLLHELLSIYLEKKNVLYQLVTSTKNQTLNELQYKFGSVYTEILVNILPLLW